MTDYKRLYVWYLYWLLKNSVLTTRIEYLLIFVTRRRPKTEEYLKYQDRPQTLRRIHNRRIFWPDFVQVREICLPYGLAWNTRMHGKSVGFWFVKFRKLTTPHKRGCQRGHATNQSNTSLQLSKEVPVKVTHWIKICGNLLICIVVRI